MKRAFNFIFALALASLFAAGLLAWYNSRQILETSRSDDQVQEFLGRVRSLTLKTQTAELHQRKYIVTGSNEDWDAYFRAIAPIREEMELLRIAAGEDSTFLAYAEEINSLVQARVDRLREVVDIRETEGLSAVQQLVLYRDGTGEMAAIVELASKIWEEAISHAVETRRKADIRARHSSNIVAIATIFALLTVAFSIHLINRHFRQRMKAEKRLVAAKEEAERANRAKSAFLAQMSHELRTPLNAIIGFTNILRKNKAGRLQEQELDYLQRVHTNGVHLLNLINDILDLSKVEAGRLELEIDEVDLAHLVEETVAQLASQTYEKNVELSAEVPPDLGPIRADPVKLRQVLVNLVGNALKFTESGCVRMIVSADRTGRPTRIDVVDTGIGIPEDQLEKIFQPFEQVESGTTRRFGGTGLGLAISDAICRQMGFHIEVESEVGVGSTFSIVLAHSTTPPPRPRRRPAQKPCRPTRTAAAKESPGRTTRRVLIIDDDPDARDLLVESIEELGYSAVAADSAVEGLKLARETPPALIALDLQMPEVDGWETLEIIGSDPELSRIPVMIVSFLADEAKPDLDGVIGVIQKPVARERLEEILRRTFDTASGRRVLVVEDDPDTRTLLTAFLGAEGFEVRGVENGGEALDALDEFDPDLILLDLLMPRMDGLSFLKALRRDSKHRTTPVVVVTAKDTTMMENERLKGVTAAILRKGQHLEEDLKEIVQTIFEPVAAEP